MQLCLLEPTLGASEELPHIKAEAVGPMGQVGRPGRSVGLPEAPTAPQTWHLGCPGVPCPKPMGHGMSYARLLGYLGSF